MLSQRACAFFEALAEWAQGDGAPLASAPAKQAGSPLSGDAAWVTRGGNSFSQSGFSVFLFFPFVSFLGFLPNSLL